MNVTRSLFAFTLMGEIKASVCAFLFATSGLTSVHEQIYRCTYIWRIGRHIVFDMCMFLMSSGRLLENNFPFVCVWVSVCLRARVVFFL